MPSPCVPESPGRWTFNQFTSKQSTFISTYFKVLCDTGEFPWDALRRPALHTLLDTCSDAHGVSSESKFTDGRSFASPSARLLFGGTPPGASDLRLLLHGRIKVIYSVFAPHIHMFLFCYNKYS